MLKEFSVDMHIHTCLSPCGDLEMLPTAIVKQAKERDLDAIGICDHNSSENAVIVKKVGAREGLKVFTGMEISSSEEVHTLAFFDENSALIQMQDIVYKNLSGENNEAFFGKQLIADENDKFIGCNKKLLIGSIDLTLMRIVRLIHDFGGIAIASHINKETFSVISQLGFIPKDLNFDALELSPNYKLQSVDFREYGLPLITSSDAHFLSDIGKVHTKFLLEDLSFSEIKMAFSGIEGRKVLF